MYTLSLLAEEIGKVSGEKVKLVNPAFECAREFRYVLEENDILCEEENTHENEFYVSDDPASFAKFANSILGDGSVKAENVFIKNFD